MKSLILLLSTLLSLFASVDFAKNETCKGCHPIIYNEFYDSQHRKSSIFEDELHKAAWEAYKKDQNEIYSCAQCHTPTDKSLLAKVENKQPVEPVKNDLQTKEAISCAYCHRIKGIKEHEGLHTNVLNDKSKLFYSIDKNKKSKANVKYENKFSLYGMVKDKTGSPFHTIDYTNQEYYTANVCMGCHKEIKNAQDLSLMNIKKASAKDEQTNCITCHMPKVQGSLSNIQSTKEHRYHGFAGAHNRNGLLNKYVKFSFNSTSDGFTIGVKNEASHDLFLHPLRVAILRVSLVKENQTITLEDVRFEKTYSKDGVEISHWLATEVKKDTMLKANQKREIIFNTKLDGVQKVKVVLGYYLIKPEKLKMLNLEKSKVATEFKILKQKFFDVKP